MQIIDIGFANILDFNLFFNSHDDSKKLKLYDTLRAECSLNMNFLGVLYFCPLV